MIAHLMCVVNLELFFCHEFGSHDPLFVANNGVSLLSYLLDLLSRTITGKGLEKYEANKETKSCLR